MTRGYEFEAVPAHKLSLLAAMLDDCVAGRGTAAVISGPVSCGKSRLLNAFSDTVGKSGGIVLRATASEAEQSLPLGIIDQLLNNAVLPADRAAEISGLVESTLHFSWPDTAAGTAVNTDCARYINALCKALLKLTELAPVVVCIDDIHHADPSSQQCLSWLVRRLRTARMMIVFTESPRLVPTYPMLHADLLHASQCRTIRLEPLSEAAISEMVQGELGEQAGALSQQYHQISGGNPLLALGMIEDAQCLDAPHRLVVDQAFANAVLSCLSRCDATVLSVARALAIANHPLPTPMLGQLLELKAEQISRAVHILTRVGLLGSDGRYRHARACAAVAHSVPPEESARLHGLLARLLGSTGEPAVRVARHLVLADGVDTEWAVRTLLTGAEQSLAAGDTEQALSLLLHARTATTSRYDAQIVSTLCRVKWRTNPTNALAYVPELIEAVRCGELDNGHLILPLHCLLWHGRFAQACEVLDLLCGQPELTTETVQGACNALLWMTYLFPQDADVAGGYSGALMQRTTGVPRAPLAHAVQTLSEIMRISGGSSRAAVDAAERMLNRLRLDDDTLGPAVVALAVLVRGDRTAAAEAWCEQLQVSARTLSAPAWTAVLSGIRAGMALRRGDLGTAQQLADDALANLPLRNLGMAMGAVLDALVQIDAVNGTLDQTVDRLAEPMASEIFRTPYGPAYLHARGTYNLATDRAQAAAMDFQACGETMESLGLELPSLITWRLNLARAHIAQGHLREAAALICDQLDRLTDAHSRVRGIALRLLASISEPGKRFALLRESIDVLQACGDRREIARSFADLSEALGEAGATSRARLTAHTARHIAEQCQAGELLQQFTTRSPAGPGTPAGRGQNHVGTSKAPLAQLPPGEAVTEGIGALSDAERRVAELAARGHTNREIAGKLYLTVSTVEQHLTRVYKKLQVTGRAGLSADFALRISA